MRASGLSAEQADKAIDSDAFGPLTAELRRAEANHHDVDVLLPRLVRARGFDDADDVAAVLRHRVAAATARPDGSGRAMRPARLIAGLVPEASGVKDDEMQRALAERAGLIEARADAVLDAAVSVLAPWVAALGAEPADAKSASAWRHAARAVAAYRDRYQVTGAAVLGSSPNSTAQKIDHARAEAVLRVIRNASVLRAQQRRRERTRETRGLYL